MIIDMFPGQGSQYQGMGAELFNKFPEHVSQASLFLNYDVVDYCLTNPKQIINQTEFTQPLLYLVCCLAYLNKKHRPDALIGHSLGLYPALFASGMVNFEQGLRIVFKRAKLMAQSKQGAMLAVIGKNVALLDKWLITNEFNDIDVANDNSPTQRVLSGQTDKIQALRPRLKELQLDTIILPVSGAFHSRYTAHAATLFFHELINEQFNEPQIPVISTTHGNVIHSTHLLEELAYQLIKPIRWYQVINSILKRYPNASFHEVGPGQVLTRINQQIIENNTIEVA